MIKSSRRAIVCVEFNFIDHLRFELRYIDSIPPLICVVVFSTPSSTSQSGRRQSEFESSKNENELGSSSYVMNSGVADLSPLCK